MNTRACRACGAAITFLKHRRKDGTDGVHPVDASTVQPGDERYDAVRHMSHFETCPEAWRFRQQPAVTPPAPVARKPTKPTPPPEPEQLDLFGGAR